MQQAYFATSPNLNCFDREHEKNLKLSLWVNHYEVQSDFVVSKHVGISANLDGAYTNQIGGELAGIYFIHFSPKNYFEVQGGYGYFNIQSDIPSLMWVPSGSEYTKYFSRYIDSRYHKVFAQPTYFLTLPKVSLGVAVKLGANFFDRYHYDYEMDDRIDYGIYTLTYINSEFSSRWAFSLEPAFRIQFKQRFFLQWSLLYTSNTQYSPEIYQRYENEELVQQKVVEQVANPQHISFLFTLGYEFKIGKKNKQATE